MSAGIPPLNGAESPPLWRTESSVYLKDDKAQEIFKRSMEKKKQWEENPHPPRPKTAEPQVDLEEW